MTSGGFNLFERLGRTDYGRHLLNELEELGRKQHGAARQCMWECEDDWYIIYTTTRVQGGPHDGSFLAQLFRPGKNGEWVQDDRRVCATRREAKARAVKWYREHSPKWAAKHPAT